MSKRQTEGKLSPGDPGYVGRGHPPKSGQIKPGEVRNPNGRAGRARSQNAETDFKSQMRQLIEKPIQSKDGQVFTLLEVLMNSLVKRANGGDVSAIKFLYDLSEKFMFSETAEEAALAALEDKEKLIEDALARVAEKRAAVQLSGGHTQDDDGSRTELARDTEDLP